MIISESNQYKYAAKGPLDAKSLVKTYNDLLYADTWQVDTDGRKVNGAYNGLITAVWLNKTDTSKNGIYYLYDAAVTSTLGIPDVTKASNWHKIAEVTEIADLTAKIVANTKAITDEIIARAAAVAAIYKAGDGDTPATGLLVEEIARASTAEQAIAETLATLIGKDTNKTVRVIAAEEIAKIVDTGNKTVSTYVADQIARLVQFKASAEITIDEDGTLGLGEVSTDKFIQGVQTLVFSGGCAV
jgi:hypothetical protein